MLCALGCSIARSNWKSIIIFPLAKPYNYSNYWLWSWWVCLCLYLYVSFYAAFILLLLATLAFLSVSIHMHQSIFCLIWLRNCVTCTFVIYNGKFPNLFVYAIFTSSTTISNRFFLLAIITNSPLFLLHFKALTRFQCDIFRFWLECIKRKRMFVFFRAILIT